MNTLPQVIKKYFTRYPHSYQHFLYRIDLLLNNIDRIIKCLIGLQFILDLLDSVVYGSVILSSEQGADRLQGRVGERPAQIHDDLSRKDDLGIPLLSF